MRRRYWILGALVLIALAIVLVFVLHKPSANRNWSEEFSKTTTTSTTPNGHIILKDVRNWTYGDKTIESKTWRDIEVDPSTITKAWFITEPFSSWKAVGHTFLSFEFADGTVLSFSIEARREEGEGYSAFRGLFGAYELSYQWGTERDFVTRRLLYLNHPVRRYPLAISAEMAQTLFKGAIADTNAIAEKPRFYNTLTDNCTNSLAHIVNEIAPKTLPYDISWNLTGYADLYLMKQRFIAKVGTATEETRDLYDLTKWKLRILTNATIDSISFSRLLDSLPTTKLAN